MVCPYCGSTISNQATFCPVCGRGGSTQNSLNEQAPVNPYEQTTPPVYEAEPVYAAEPAAEPAPAPKKKKKKNVALIIILIIVGVLVGSALLCCGGALLIGGGSIFLAESPAGVLEQAVTVVPKPSDKLKEAFNLYCDSEYATLASDNSYLKIDDNPDDYDDYYIEEADDAIISVNSYLGFPDSVRERMWQTSYSDGTQTATHGDYTVSWTFHPDEGLEVTYSVD